MIIVVNTQLQHDVEVNPGPGQTTSQGIKPSEKNNVKIAHLNVRSLKQRDHFIQVKDTVQTNDFDVFTISETWLNCSVSDLEIEIPGYDVFRVDRQDKRGGGVCIYARHGFKTEVLHDISGISETGLHQLWIKIQVRNLKSFLVCTTYRPPNVPITCINTDLSISLVAALLYNKPVYILDDLNCNLLELNIPESQVLIEFFQSFNLSQVVTKPTRSTGKSESLLDVILVSNTNQVLESDVLISSISDHDLVYIKLPLKREKSPPIFIITRSFKNYSSSEFLKDVATSPWSVLEIFDDPDDKLFAFNVLFNDVLDKHAAVKTILIRGRPNPYVTEEIRALMRTRDEWKRAFKKTKDPLAWSAYKNFSREVKHEIGMAGILLRVK